MKFVMCLVIALGVVGCRGQQYSMADNKILCDEKDQAFQVMPGAGDVSFLRHLAGAESVCQQRRKP